VAVANDIIAAKKITAPEVRRNVQECTRGIATVARLLDEVTALQKSPFTSANAEHEKMLETLWDLLRPGIVRSGGRVTSEWGEIGFQGKDPATDFRGGGLLGLHQLLYFAEQRNERARDMLTDGRIREVAKYPWSCCGINVTAEMVRMLEKRSCALRLYTARTAEDAMRVFNDIYCDVFEYFHEAYALAEPTDVMGFPPKFKESIAQAEEALAKAGRVPIVPAPAASDGPDTKKRN